MRSSSGAICLDRAVLVSLDPIAETERRLEADFWADFDAAAPAILGALLDAVSIAIARESTVTMARWPRMADFARWVTAAEPALGLGGGRVPQEPTTPTAARPTSWRSMPTPSRSRCASLMATVDTWEGRATELLDVLATIAGESATKRKDWPAAAHTLGNRLERLAPNLRAIGVEFGRDRTGNRRTVTLCKGLRNAVTAVIAVIRA